MKCRCCGQSNLYSIEILDYLLIFAHVILLVIVEDFFLGHLSVKNISSVRFVNDNQIEGTGHQIGRVCKDSPLEQTLDCRYANLGFEVDIIVINAPNSRLSGRTATKPVTSFNDVFVANKHFFDLENRELSLRELQKYPILMLNRKSTTSEYLHQLFQQHQLDLIPEIELSSNDLLLDLAGIGLGIAFVPDFVVNDNNSDLFILNIRESLPSRHLVLAYSNQLPMTPATAEFVKYF
jgi:hypothetical protein